MTDLPTLFAALEIAATALDAAQECVVKGEAWLRTHPPTHHQYREAVQRLAQRRREAAVAEAALQQAERAWQAELAADNGLSLRCQVCGEPVSGYPPLKPGRHVHLNCL